LKIFVKNAVRGLIQCIPFVGPFIEQTIFGTIDDKEAKAQAEELHKKLDGFLPQPKPTPQGQINNLPYTSIGGLLKGRDEAMKQLDSRLSHNKTKVAAITQVQAVHGLGGVGKTRLAIEYAWFALENKKYNAVLFVIADSPVSIDTNLAALASLDLLNLPESNQPNQSVTVKAVLNCLASRNDWLLIFDNVDTPEVRKHLNQIIPHISLGRIIITSRSSNWPANITDLSIDKLSTPDAAVYLLQTTQNKRTTSNDDNRLATQLAEKLDGLPIALEQAAAYISQRHISFQTYLNEFESSKKEILSWHKPGLTNYPAPVLAVWQSSEKQLSAPARAILRLSSLLSPEPIPVSLFESSVKHINSASGLLSSESSPPDAQQGTHKSELRNALDVRSLLAELADYSLIKLTESSFTIHRLVQDSIRLSIPEKSLKPLIQIILDIVNDSLPAEPQPDDVRSWHIYKPLESHLSSLISHADKLDISSPTGHLRAGLGIYLKTLARFKEAESLMRRALEIDEKSFGKDHPNASSDLNNLAALYQATNRLAEAEPLIRRALEIDEKSLGKNHPKVAIRLNNLAQLLQDTNRLKEAESLMRRALEIDEKFFGSEDPNVAIALNNLAVLLKATNRLKEAEPLMRRALEIDEKSFSSEHPKVAIRLNNLAQLLQDTNRLKEAEPLIRRAIEIMEKSFGPNHPNVAIALNNLAQLLKDTSRLKEAEPLMRLVIEIFEKSLGLDHPNVAAALNNLAQLLKDTNRPKEVEPLIRRALKIDEKSFGKDHPNVARDLNNLASLLEATNHKDEAKKLYERAVKILEDSYGPAHPSTQTVRQNLASLG
jgi:tetratricopeptide (TPR) repeat protein